MADALPALRTRVVADRYDVIRALGRGAFGHTYLAHDRLESRNVALKLLDPERSDHWKARELLEREGAVLRGLRHHGIPAIYDMLAAEWDGRPSSFLVMEYIDGMSLADAIESRQSLTSAEVLQLFLELLGVLEYLHGRVPTILHRDIKPANIVVRPDGSPVLVDFGSVRHIFRADDDARSTVAGTYGYMPYEQYMGQASPASDLYALAATFLHVITARAPRDFMNEEGRLAVPAVLPGDARLQPVIARLLQPSPADRFASAREARLALLSPAPVPSVSPVAHPSRVAVAAAPAVVSPVHQLDNRLRALLAEPAPRPMDKARRGLLRDLVPTIGEYMDGNAKITERVPVTDYLLLVAVTVATFGIYPLTFHAIARARRKQLAHFIAHGTRLEARIVRIEQEENAFGSKVARVHYTFDVNGTPRRDSDRVLQSTANRWGPGDVIDVLYMASVDDSVIVSGR